jgi:hypothetical protein
MTQSCVLQPANLRDVTSIDPSSMAPLSAEEKEIADNLELIRQNLIAWEACEKKDRKANFHQEKEVVFKHAKDLLVALHNLDPSLVRQPLVATEEIDYQAVIAALAAPEKTARAIHAKGLCHRLPDAMNICLADAQKKPTQKKNEFGINLGPMLIDLQFKHEAFMHGKMAADTKAIEKDTADLELIRQTLSTLHTNHKKDGGVNIEQDSPEAFKKLKELLDAVHAIDPSIWKKETYVLDENDYQGLLENLNGKTQAISRVINSKYLSIEQTTQLRNLLNNALADTERKRQRESDQIISNQKRQ